MIALICVSLFLMIGFLSMSFAMESKDLLTMTSEDRLAGEIQNVIAYRQSHDPVNLALAVGNHDDIASAKLTQNWVLLNEQHKNEPGDVPILSVNFNDLGILQKISGDLPNTFDQIAMDISSFKFTHWTADHLRCFYTMLKPGGKLIIPPSIQFLSVWENKSKYPNWEEIHAEIIENLSASTSLRSSAVSFMGSWLVIEPAFIANHKEKIDSLVKRHQEILLPVIDDDDEAFWRVASENPDLAAYPKHVLENTEKLSEILMLKLYLKPINQDLRQDTINYNWLRIMGETFGEGHVHAEEQGLHPFREGPMLLLVGEKV